MKNPKFYQKIENFADEFKIHPKIRNSIKKPEIHRKIQLVGDRAKSDQWRIYCKDISNLIKWAICDAILGGRKILNANFQIRSKIQEIWQLARKIENNREIPSKVGNSVEKPEMHPNIGNSIQKSKIRPRVDCANAWHLPRSKFSNY